MLGLARRRAAAVLAQNVDAFERLGYRETTRPSPLEVRLAPGGAEPALHLRMAPHGRIFGGTYALEVATAEPTLPASGGLSVRGRGLVRLQGVRFRARGGDAAGRELAARLERDERLAAALADVHFEQVRVERDGRAVVRHLGGSLVWLLFPPLVRAVPLVDAQARATVRALAAFAGAGR